MPKSIFRRKNHSPECITDCSETDDAGSSISNWEKLFSSEWVPTAPVMPMGTNSQLEWKNQGRWFRMSSVITARATSGVPERVLIAGLWKTVSHRIINPSMSPICALLTLSSELTLREPLGKDQVRIALRSCLYLMQDGNYDLPVEQMIVSGPMSAFIDGRILEGSVDIKIDSSGGGLDTSTFFKLVSRGLISPYGGKSKISWTEQGHLGVVINENTLNYLKKSGMLKHIWNNAS